MTWLLLILLILLFITILGGWQSLHFVQVSPSTKAIYSGKVIFLPDHQRVYHHWSMPITVASVPLIWFGVKKSKPILATGTWEKVSCGTSANKVNRRSAYCSSFVEEISWWSPPVITPWAAVSSEHVTCTGFSAHHFSGGKEPGRKSQGPSPKLGSTSGLSDSPSLFLVCLISCCLIFTFSPRSQVGVGGGARMMEASYILISL